MLSLLFKEALKNRIIKIQEGSLRRGEHTLPLLSQVK